MSRSSEGAPLLAPESRSTYVEIGGGGLSSDFEKDGKGSAGMGAGKKATREGAPRDVDLEAGILGSQGAGSSGGNQLYPGSSEVDDLVRWGFCRKVWGVVSLQLLITAAMIAATLSSTEVTRYVQTNGGLAMASMILPMVLLIPLWFYRSTHPHNLFLLAGFTFSMGYSVALVTTFYQAHSVLAAVGLTGGVTTGLTLYTIRETRRGSDFTLMGPMLFSALLTLLLWSIIAIFVPMPGSRLVMAGLGAIIFSGYIVYDTHIMVKYMGIDEWVWASINIYLDIINLFLRLLHIFGDRR